MPTIADVAARAGVSRTTVSHVLSGNRPVSPETRNQVQAIIREMGFRPSRLARGLRMQRSHTIGLILPDITNPFYPMLARGLQDVVGEVRYHTFLCNSDSQGAREREFLLDLVDRQVDGIILSSFMVDYKDIEVVVRAGLPLVCIGPRVNDPRVDLVLTEDTEGALAAGRFLIKRGYNRLGLLGPDISTVPAAPRRAGFLQAVSEAGLSCPPEWRIDSDFTMAGGKAAMKRLLEQKERPNAVFCANDLIAMGALQTLRECGISVPQQMALVGFDNIEAASLITPALTTILNPAYEIGRVAGRLLLDRLIDGYTGERRCANLPCSLIVRESA